MRSRFFFSGLFSIFVILLCIIAVIPVAGTPSPQMSATEQQGTINAIVNDRFTATAIEQAADVATLAATQIPSITPIPTLTLMPTATFEGSFSALSGNLPTNSTVIDISMEAFEHYAEGWEQYWREDYRDAEDEFDEVIDLEPEWAEAYFARTINHFERNDFDDALDDIEMAAELLGELDVGMLSWRIFLYNEFDDLDAAILDGERIVAENPYDIVGLSNLAFAYLNTGQFETAVEVINLSLLYDPNDLFNFELRRDAHDELNRRDDRRFDIHMIEGIEAYNDDNFDDAIEAFDDAIRRAETTNRSEFNTAIAYWNLALTHLVDDNEDEAFDAFDAAEEAYPEMGYIYYLRGFAEFGEVRDDDYLDNLNTGIERVPDFPNMYVSRGLFYEGNNDEELALPDHWRYLQLSQAHSLLWESIDPLGETLRLPYFAGWEHRFIIDAEDGDRLNITAAESGIGNSFVDPIIVVLDPNGNPIASNDDENRSTYDAEISRFRLTADGQYTVVIGVGTGGSSGITEVEIDLN